MMNLHADFKKLKRQIMKNAMNWKTRNYSRPARMQIIRAIWQKLQHAGTELVSASM